MRKKRVDRERPGEHANERVFAVVVEHQHRRHPAQIQRERLGGPTGVQRRGQCVLMFEARNAWGRRARRDQRQHRNGSAGAVGPTQQQIAVVMERLELKSSEIHDEASCFPLDASTPGRKQATTRATQRRFKANAVSNTDHA